MSGIGILLALLAALLGLAQLAAVWAAGYFWGQRRRGLAAALLGGAFVLMFCVPALGLLVGFL